ncbi:heavy metal translocating P-type ATPase [Cycloclasticus sp. P1]|uniref:heavy metal translocating P-type ATPase n=1 Tax=Cycloclasticus sp. (strain P1) TaxID=385025 RepID=UPI000286AA7F|nr:heavy metal translocating P-type ATPase [Cycloclasticus sp. P1]AFT66793.1 cation transport P-type ATPase [Cycloclasticus sp. P1]
MTIDTKLEKEVVCFHCGLEVPSTTKWGINFDGQWRAMCCPGCEAVAQAIINNGLADYYQKRTAYAVSMDSLSEELEFNTAASLETDCSNEEVIETSLIIEGITCSACIWLLERQVQKLRGVVSFKINYATRRGLLKTIGHEINIADVLTAIRAIGYQAVTFDANKQFLNLQKERKDFLSRIGVAVFCGMQVMMITLGIYVADPSEIDPNMLQFLKWISALLTLPVLLFSAKPFLYAACRDIKNKMPGMDVPVALGISLGFFASLFNTYQGKGDTYYESVCMFVLFLMLARYVEFLTRWYAMSSSERITQAVPMMAKRIAENNVTHKVAANSLALGDYIQINPGEVVPADAVVVDGESQVDESILTGESEPIRKRLNDSVLGGSHNLDNTLIAKVSCVGKDSTLSTIARLIEQAHAQKPAWVETADRFASVFVLMVILVTLGSAIFGYWQGHVDWFSTALSVLVVTCPCALSLATPTAYTAAMSALFDHGIIITKGTALEKLASINRVVFDKTGTLTEGSMNVSDCTVFDGRDKQSIMDIAISLERFSDHPIARAFKHEKTVNPQPASAIEQTNGAGLKGSIEGKTYYIGSQQYIKQSSGLMFETHNSNVTQVYLADDVQCLAVFEIHDDIRQGASSAVNWLKSDGKKVSLLSGDKLSPVAWLAKKVAIEDFKSDATPSDKLKEIDRMQRGGEQVAMVGDGVNDAPILAKADVSISVSGASQLARASSDILLMNNDMQNLQHVFKLSKKTKAIIKQNMAWALVYNIGALPLAMAGHVEPWQAALGMSISSLVVVLNSFLLRFVLPAASKSKKISRLHVG